MTTKNKLLQIRHDFYNTDELDYDSFDYFTSIEYDLKLLEEVKQILKDNVSNNDTDTIQKLWELLEL